MARTLPTSQPTNDTPQTQPGDWQALRGELVALLDQVEGQYAQAGTGDPSFAGFAQRMRDLRYQVADVDPDDRRREALRSVKRQVDRFNERGELEPMPHADNVLQSAIQQIRARAGTAPAIAETHAAAAPQAAAPHFDQLAHSMAGMTGRLAEFEAELKAQRADAPHVRAIADQVSQLSQVVELLAGAVGETGQVKRLESQIAGLAQMLSQASKPDFGQLTERLDGLSATVDRLADLQVQQIQHVVREAETAPRKDADANKSMQAIEAGVRNIYDRIDSLEHSVTMPPAELDRITGALEQITSRLGADTARPERLLGLVDALNGRINEIEDRNEALGGLKGDIDALRKAVLGAIEPRFASIETQLGELGEKFASRGDGVGMAQLEAQIRQLVARMDQTGEQLSGLARLYGSEERDVAPDYEALANLAADRAMAKQQASQEALADLVASRTAEAVARRMPAADLEALADMAAAKAQAAPAGGRMLSERGLAEFEARITRLVDGLARAKPGEGFGGVQDGIGRVEERLKGLEAALLRRGDEKPAPAAPVMAAPAIDVPIPAATPMAPEAVAPVRDTMPRNPAADAPLKEFGFPDLGPVRAALEAKNGPRKLHPAIEKPASEIEPRFEMQPITPEMTGGVSRAKPASATAEMAPPAFDPSQVVRPPRPDSSLDDTPLSAAPLATAPTPVTPVPAPAVPEVAASSRNTFIEAARRAAQRQNQPSPGVDANSLIGRAFSRLQAGSQGKPEKAMPEPVPPEPAQDEITPSAESKARRKRKAKAAPEPVAMPEPTLELADAALISVPEQSESFLVRNRKPILITASLIAVSFMTLNLVMQRLGNTDSHPANASASIGKTGDLGGGNSGAAPAPAAVMHDAPAPAAPMKAGADHPMTTPKPISEAASPPMSLQPAAGPGPRIIPTDPVTTASINPALSFAPVTQATMPPPLAAANAIAAAPADAPTASTDGKPVALASIAPADAVGANPTTAPTALDSPVKVDLPPDGLGPLDLRQAAADGDARAQFEIAAIYSEGRAVSQDFKQAEVWYERAAAQGFGPAQYRLGNLYETGKGVTKDLDQARLWYQRAAEGGNRMAMHNLAALYAGGQAGKQDFASAAEWFERAADLGMKDSQFNLGMLYARGLGVPQNLETSYKWFAIAATGGDAGAIKARDNVARSLNADAIKRLTAEIAAWKVQPINLVANFAPIGTWEKTFNPGAAITDKTVVTKVQQALVRLGYDVGTPDGHAGPKTALAIKAFEHGTGMTEVGSVNPRLLAVLGSQPV